MTESAKVPACVGIIMDGNRRWARAQGLPLMEGHRRGYETFRSVCEWAKQLDIKNLVFYAFSTENWNRNEEEVAYLMGLLERALASDDFEKLIEEGGRLRVAGQVERLSPKLQERIRELEERSKNNPYTVVIALSYGGRQEIVAAANRALEAGRTEVTEADIADNLWTAGMPDPDLIIRTSGEQRLSNFLTWQSVYSELFFTDTLWPDFSEEEFRGIVEAYGRRERRKGV